MVYARCLAYDCGSSSSSTDMSSSLSDVVYGAGEVVPLEVG